MKKIFLLIFLFASIMSCYSTNEIELQDAVNKATVRCVINGNQKSTHYERALKIVIENLLNEPQNIKIGNGLYMKSDDSIYQDFIITKEEFIVLQPKERKEKELYAMCVKANRGAPDQENTFRPMGYTNDKLAEISRFIEKNKFYIPESQYALWSVSDSRALYDITGYDTTAARKLREEVARILGIPIPAYDYMNDSKRNYYIRPLKSIGGTFDYKLSKTRSIHIAMFDLNGILVRELFRDDEVKPGEHHFDYEYDARQYTDEFYFIKLIADGTVVVNIELKTYQ